MDKKIMTDNPLVDEVVYYLKRLVTESVIKDGEQADNNETLESLRNYSRYEECVENRESFFNFEYTPEDFKQILGDNYDYYSITKFLGNNKNIPVKYRKALTENKKKYYLNNYLELNNYYRMLNGKPNVEDTEEDYIYITKEDILNHTDRIPDDDIENYISVPIHELQDYEINVLEVFGILDDLKEKYKDKKYLNFLGNKSIDIYNARTQPNFSLLYIPEDIPSPILYRFKDNYIKNRVYTLKCVYNDAFKLGSDYYDNFIRLFIMIQTVIDTISEIPDIIIKKDFFDIRTVRLFFKSYGINNFDGIPMKYQIAMIKNMNTLLKYKATTRNIVDICSLFGFDNLQVFKYYLLKDRKLDKDGNFILEYKEVEDEDQFIHYEEDKAKNFELKFIKVPIQDNLDDYITNTQYTISYDEMTLGDKYWDGGQDHELVKQQMLDLEFNYVQSKYISVDTLYDLTKLTFQLCYFYNMIFATNYKGKSIINLLRLEIPEIKRGTTFLLTDVFSFLFSLMYTYQGFEDNIISNSTSKTLSILGFNFKANLGKISEYIMSKGYTAEELGIKGFQIPKASPTSFNQLLNIYTKNKDIHDHIVKEMINADNKDIYDIYKYLYDSLMITNYSMDMFKITDESGKTRVASSFTEYLSYRDLILYTKLVEINKLELQDKLQTISDLIDNIIYDIQQYIDGDEFKYIYNIYPTVSGDVIKDYVYRVIDFFKSYKIQIYNISTIYKFDDRLNNRINIIDRQHIDVILEKGEDLCMNDKLSSLKSKLNPSHDLGFKEYINKTNVTTLLDNFKETITLKEEISNIHSTLSKSDVVDINDIINIQRLYD